MSLLIVFLLWFLYLGLGMFWLNHTIQKNNIKEYNLLGSLILILIWPIHLFYQKFKK